MKQNLSKIYTLVVVIALVVLGGWSAWDIYRLRTSNSDAARINVEQIKSNLENSYNQSQSFSDGTLSQTVRQIFKDNPDLELLTIYSQGSDSGIDFHYDRGEDVELLNYSESSPLTMKDLPDYKYNQLLKSKISTSLDTKGISGLQLDVIYKVVDRVAIYNILIRLLIVVVVLFFTTLFMIYTVSHHSSKLEDSDHEDPDSGLFESDDEPSLDWDENEHPGVPDTNDFSLDDENFGDLDLNNSGEDFDDLDLGSDDLSFDDGINNFSNEDLSLDTDMETVVDLSDELNLDTSDDDMDFELDDPGEEFDLNLNDSEEKINMDLDEPMEEFNLNTDSDGELSLDDPVEDFSLDLDTDIPEEEDLKAMDHEVSPISDFDDDLGFDNIEDTFSDDSTSLYSPKNGIGWEDFIEERVNLELEKAASNDEDLILGVLQSEKVTDDNYKSFADLLKEEFNYPDMIYEYKDNGFALIVPNTDLDDALRIFESFTGTERDEYGKINVGLSSRNGRLITGGRIFMEAENALQKAVEDGEKNIVGFRSDPDKFREFLSKK